MDLLTWGDEHTIGVHAIDDGHQALFDSINELYRAVLDGAETSRIAQQMRQMATHARIHFHEEEAILAAASYPELAVHSLKHQFLLGELEELMDRVEKGAITFNPQSLNFLRYWFNDHMQNDDRAFAPWLQSRGLA